MRRSRSHPHSPNTRNATLFSTILTRGFLWKSLLGSTLLVALAGNVFLSRQYLFQLSTSSSSLAWTSLDEVHLLAEASGLLGIGNDNISNTTNNNPKPLKRSLEQPNSTRALSQPEPPRQMQEPPLPNQATTTPTIITLWCFLDKSSTFVFFHFPHALQSLSQCWSFFQSKRQEILQSKNNHPAVSPQKLEFQCHINLYQSSGFGSVDQDWRAALVVDLMQCTHSYGAFDYSDIASRNQVLPWSLSSTQINDNHTTVPPTQKGPRPLPQINDNHTTVPPTQKGPRPLPANHASHIHYFFRQDLQEWNFFRYFSHPSHVLELQKRLQQRLIYSNTTTRPGFQDKSLESLPNNRSIIINNNNNNNRTGNVHGTRNDTPNTLRIGLVDRLSKRRLGNIDLLEQAIVKAFPHAIVERGIMERLSPLQQFAWWSRQSIVILVHGAAASNLLFLQPNISAVIELYPAHYYWWGYWHLAQSSQVRHYAYFPIWTEQRNLSQFQWEPHMSPELRLLDDYGKHCLSIVRRNRARDVKTMKPSIPHVMVLLRRAVTDRQEEIRRRRRQQQQGDSNHTQHSVVSSSYVPQIARMDVTCVQARYARAFLKRVEVHVDDDPPPSLFAEYSSG